MTKKLVIVESPAKARTINRILGEDYIVKSSMGHVRDLPIKNIGVDVENSFEPKYVVVKGRKKIIDDLKKTAQTCSAVYLAPDPDREGEAIAWHLKALLEHGKKKIPFFRVQYNEVTPRAVKSAFENPGELDLRRVHAQQARRILDRLVGYTVSPMLWRRLRRGLSAGRVQSVALRLVCEREEEINKFVPEEYWILGAMVRKLVAPLDPFRMKLVRLNNEKADIKNSEQARQARADLEGRSLRVLEIETKVVTKRAAPPYITSSLQQAASNYCSFSPKHTMSIAQKLYEGIDLGEGPIGLITYMRTDSLAVSKDALSMCRDYITKTYGEAFCPTKPNFYKSRASAQEAHEAIRPTDVNRTPENLTDLLDPGQLKVYRLIWKRFVTSQMTPAKIEQRTAKVEAVPPSAQAATYLFHATASEVKFPGYMKVSGADMKQQKKDEDEVEHLPELSEGESLECLEWLEERKETRPPGRYSEASLIRSLEQNGVGRPSTYAQTISTLYERKYVTGKNKSLTPTELGLQVSNLLVTTLGNLFNVKFTASMEESLDAIEKGSVEWTKMLQDFYGPFKQWMEKTKEPPADAHIVNRVLTVLQSVEKWAAEVKVGKRTYNDQKFVESIRKQVEKDVKKTSRRQLETLLKIACHYIDQVPEIKTVVAEAGYAEMLNQPELQKPREATIRKLEILRDVPVEKPVREFTDSLRTRVEGGRALTEAQIRALNNIMCFHAGLIENFDALKESLDIDQSEVEQDKESKHLIDALAPISQWKPPVTRGKKVFDDKAFYTSLMDQFIKKGFLSVRQRAALKKMIKKYRTHIPDYDKVAELCNLDKKSTQRNE